MSYEVLARKLRPAGFDALVGQDHVVKALRHALDHDRLHHAYLFTGTRGVGKTTIARIVAKSLNCEQGISSTPCGQCSVCIEVKENRFIDLIEVDAASRTGVDDTRDLLENAQYLPSRGRYKVYLIDEVHMLSTASFNALLKTLEEPPDHVKFLLATTDPKKVPVTVLSRCLQFQLRNLTREMITTYLQKVLKEEGVKFEEEALAVIARCASGSMRDALSLTDQAIAYGQGQLLQADVVDMLGVVGQGEVAALLDGLASGSAEHLLTVSGTLAERNADFADITQSLMEAFHHLAVKSALGETHNFSAEELHLYYQIALIGHRDLSIAPDERSGFEMMLLRMLAFAPDQGSKVPIKTKTQVTAANSGIQDSSNTATVSTRTQADEPLVESSDKAAKSKAAGPDKQQGEQPSPGGKAEEWASLAEQLSVGGVTRMIAEHSNLLKMELPEVVLRLDEGHDTLLSDAQQQHLSRALEQVLGQQVELAVEIGRVTEETPAQRRGRLARERQAEAEAHIQRDKNVANLLSKFDGRVEEIRPLN